MALVNNPIDIIVNKDISINTIIIDKNVYTFNMSFTKNENIEIEKLTKNIYSLGAEVVELKNGFSSIRYVPSIVSIPFTQDITISLNFGYLSKILPQDLMNKIFDPETGDFALSIGQGESIYKNHYIKVEPDTLWKNIESNHYLYEFGREIGNKSIDISYPIINNNGNKSFLIKLHNTTNNMSTEFVAKTVANKDSSVSNYVLNRYDNSIEEYQLLKNIYNTIYSHDYSSYKLNVQIEEVVQ